jgi:hypothetical protein
MSITYAQLNKPEHPAQELGPGPASRDRRRHRPRVGRRRRRDDGRYSFDRAVICDRARTVDLLLANNFHFEHNSAVLSIKGYPPSAFDLVRDMLRSNPRLEVYALHDATEEGCRLAYRLEHEADWFVGRPVTDVGLHLAQATRFPESWVPASGPVSPGAGIDANEAQWLSRHSLELAALRPEQILKAVFWAMNPAGAARDADDGDGFG